MAARKKRGADNEKRMSLGEHLLELRKRLVISAIAILLGAILGFVFAETVWVALREPILGIGESKNASINYTGLTEAFDLRFQIAITLGILLASPVWLYQILAFLVPGLTKKEKRYTFGFFFSAVPLFAAGAATGWFLFPNMAKLLLSFVPDEDATFLTARYLLDFVIKLVLAVGIAFVLPVFLVLLNMIGVISARSILKGWRVAILLIATFCALATPAADVISMFLLAVPMVFLYFVAAGLAWLHDKRAAKRIDELLDPAVDGV